MAIATFATLGAYNKTPPVDQPHDHLHLTLDPLCASRLFYIPYNNQKEQRRLSRHPARSRHWTLSKSFPRSHYAFFANLYRPQGDGAL